MKIESNSYQVVFGRASTLLNNYCKNETYSSILIIVDEHTKKDCLYLIESELDFDYNLIEIRSGEENKTIETAQSIWDAMITYGLDRYSLVIDLGGGVIGDMGGFCASTYMRGIDFVQVPTTLLSQVDASVGGKLGVDMDAYKNIVGLFNNPQQVIIDVRFLNSLPHRELKSGFAELLKHGLIRDKTLWDELLKFELLVNSDWQKIVYDSVVIKNHIVMKDPSEKGIRKILNFGHTIGHAIESELLYSGTRIFHGEAIIIGMICESKLSAIMGLISFEDCDLIKSSLLEIYPDLPKTLPNMESLISRMKRDKKNNAGQINFSLLTSIGNCTFDKMLDAKVIAQAMEYYLN